MSQHLSTNFRISRNNGYSKSKSHLLLSNHILTPLIPNPNLMNLPSRNINPLPNSKRHLFSFPIMLRIIIRVSDSQRPPTNKMCRQTAMRVRGIMGVAE